MKIKKRVCLMSRLRMDKRSRDLAKMSPEDRLKSILKRYEERNK